MKLVNTIVTAVLVLVMAGCSRVEQAPAAAQVSTVPVVQLRGSDAELGAQHGQQLGEQVRLLQQNYLNVYLRDESTLSRALAGAVAFEPFISPAHLNEINSLARAANIDPHRVVLAQCFLDLQSMFACSTIALPAGAAPDHVARIGRNLDFPGLDVADTNTVLLVYHPRDRYAFAAVSWPGFIGVLSGMNEHGLTLANMEVTREARSPTAMPYALLYRTILENCRTVDEAIALLQKTSRQTANNLMLMDAVGNRAVAEITPEKLTIRRADDKHALISTNQQHGQDEQPKGFCNRYDTLCDLSAQQFGSVDEKSVEKMLSAASQDKLTMQSMVFEPANRVIWLATGTDAAKNTFGRIDLKSYFH